MRQLEFTIENHTWAAELLEDEAPKTIEALLPRLPVVERTIPTQWSGRAWRTMGDYKLFEPGSPVENVADRLGAGDVIYYPRINKIGAAYGDAKWLGPFMLPREVTRIARITEGVDTWVEVCMRIIFEGPFEVEISVA